MSRLTLIRNRIDDAEGIPKSVRFYLFGSILEDSIGSDIDLLCVYDAEEINPRDAYTILQPLFEDLHSRFGSPVHPVVLTQTEEQQVCFVETEECIPVADQRVRQQRRSGCA
jgi:predicted nucleotidyltransferase